MKGILAEAQKMKILVVGDVMLDRFVWGRVSRISPEAPVPIVEFDRESVMPGGAANVARNLTALGAPALLFGAVGRDETARSLKTELKHCLVGCDGLLEMPNRMTSVKTRIIAHRQQVVRVDRESKIDLDDKSSKRLLAAIDAQLDQTDAVIVGDYGKGTVTQHLLEGLKRRCRERGIWISLDPKPVHHLDLSGLSLITPNRKEAFELAGVQDDARAASPLDYANLMSVADKLLGELKPAVLLITLGDQGMLLCQKGRAPFHMPTVAQEVFDVSGAGDTVIASFTLAIAAGASPQEAVIFSNHAAGVVVGKVGTATVSPEELAASFNPL
jgi:D-beta-D-heptose 7-phosphate kinase/D-beta-D-heptose 1-phosphate adenosyltransferase